MERRWKLVLAFIGGTVFAELAADPTDYLFFQLRQQLTAEQGVLVWYFLTAGFYTALFIAAYAVASARIVTPETFIYVMMALVAFGGYMSWRILASQGVHPEFLAIVLGIPLIVAMGMLWRLRQALE